MKSGTNEVGKEIKEIGKSGTDHVFRWLNSRMDERKTWSVPDFPILPGAGEALGVVVDVAQCGVDHGEAFGVMAGGEFIAHAHAAVQLNRLLADGAAGAADLYLGRRHRAL